MALRLALLATALLLAASDSCAGTDEHSLLAMARRSSTQQSTAGADAQGVNRSRAPCPDSTPSPRVTFEVSEPLTLSQQVSPQRSNTLPTSALAWIGANGAEWCQCHLENDFLIRCELIVADEQLALSSVPLLNFPPFTSSFGSDSLIMATLSADPPRVAWCSTYCVGPSTGVGRFRTIKCGYLEISTSSRNATLHYGPEIETGNFCNIGAFSLTYLSPTNVMLCYPYTAAGTTTSLELGCRSLRLRNGILTAASDFISGGPHYVASLELRADYASPAGYPITATKVDSGYFPPVFTLL
ncbi:unnamed protein product [Polarella glacialis]|uniref:Uncharacterized protein n=1 Tax=Polarella glacialis TaxID=89957 RepID=A0A813G301_POLGL|nr:unnamed protein product [Polarella glacialis]